jgi:hypothetical protein
MCLTDTCFTFEIIWLSNFLALIVTDESDSRKALCSINLISTILVYNNRRCRKVSRYWLKTDIKDNCISKYVIIYLITLNYAIYNIK